MRSQLYQILVEDTVEKGVDLEEFMDYEDSMEDPRDNREVIGSIHAISLHALVGNKGHQTIRMVGKIKNQPVIILLDSGSSHNFLNQKVAKNLNCIVQTIKGVQITVANDESLQT